MALDAGATFVNDVTAFRGAARDGGAGRRAGCRVRADAHAGRAAHDAAASHATTTSSARSASSSRERVAVARGAGIERERILVDPGIGFGKTVAHNLELLDRLGELAVLGQPILIGTSRKSFLGALAGDRDRDRLAGTIATNVIALLRGASVLSRARRRRRA